MTPAADLAASEAGIPVEEAHQVTGDQTKLLEELTKRLRNAFGEGLVSAVLYGSGATGEMHGKFSDLNVLCVMKTITPLELKRAEGVFHWWHSFDNPSPLLLTESEFRNGTDCFAIEFHDIVESHRVLAGEDVVKDLVIDDRFYRGQVEHELRAKLLRLRQKAGGMLSDKGALLRLMTESVSTFANLARHALRLAGHAAPVQKREAIAACAVQFGIDPAPFYTLLDLRSGAASARKTDPPVLLGDYMQQIEVLTEAVDRLAKG
jgi:hypothetical protein